MAGIGLGWGIGIGLEAAFPGIMLAGGHGLFWDGIANGLGATVANDLAGAVGAATIGQTFTGSALGLAEKVGIPYTSLLPRWEALSRAFASGAGSATVAVGSGASTTSVYGSTELPAFSRTVTTAYWYVR